MPRVSGTAETESTSDAPEHKAAVQDLSPVKELQQLWEEYHLDPLRKPWLEGRDEDSLKIELDYIKESIEESRASALDEPAEYDFSHIVLWDVQGFSGGWRVFVGSNGNTVVQVINSEAPADTELPDGKHFWNHEFTLSLSAQEIGSIRQALKKAQFFSMVLAEGYMTPDEARPSITVRLKNGKSRNVSTVVSNQHPGFTAVYEALLDLVERTKTQLQPTPTPYGPDEPVPDGFEILRK